MASSVDTLRLLRLFRSAPPPLVETDPKRRAVYSAASEQFEQLLSASATIGFAARPLTLFYALSQGVRSIAAAAVRGPDWQPQAHGAKQRNAESVLSASIEVRKTGSLGLLSTALNASRFTGSIRLAAVWSALPELAMLSLDRARPRALRVELSELESDPATGMRVWVSNLPDHLRSASAEDLRRELERYPTPLGYGQPGQEYGKVPLWQFDALLVDWPVVPRPERDPSRVNVYKSFEMIALQQPDGSRWLIPSIDDEGRVPHLLQSWWLVLFSLSTFARYQPAEWREALDVDRSQVAVPLEHALDAALTALPQLIFQALLDVAKGSAVTASASTCAHIMPGGAGLAGQASVRGSTRSVQLQS